MRWRTLTETEIAAYDVCPPALARRARLVHVRVLPRGYVGMTLGRWILLTQPPPPDRMSALVAHELVHLRQWDELGVLRFLARYLSDFGRGLRRHRRWHAAYRSIGLEVSAREEAAEWSRRSAAGGTGGGSTGGGGEALP